MWIEKKASQSTFYNPKSTILFLLFLLLFVLSQDGFA
jgi:hypothetical protein